MDQLRGTSKGSQWLLTQRQQFGAKKNKNKNKYSIKEDMFTLCRASYYAAGSAAVPGGPLQLLEKWPLG